MRRARVILGLWLVRALWLAWAGVGIACLFQPQPALAGRPTPTEYQVKAAFLFNFAKFVDWPPDKFSSMLARIQAFLQGEELFVQDCYVGADPNYRMPIRIITEKAWQSLFARNMFIPLRTQDEYKTHIPEFTVLALPSFKCEPMVDGTGTETAIVINFAQRMAIVANTHYGGEIKKSIFTIMNFLMPLQNVMAMHCSANVGEKGDVALFFGLSGTGKTTLSADPRRKLIGDDEHGWSDESVFNFEGGCYAKVIRLSAEHEPEIYGCTRKFGTILENVVYDPTTRRADLDDDRTTENTRASYPLEFIPNALPAKMSPTHPKNVIFLTCDASGVLPPIARLDMNQTMYHFISGYTSKIAGTEMGLGIEPEIIPRIFATGAGPGKAFRSKSTRLCAKSSSAV
jgi:phosphoenolpyruvate carboxykinase (ATP)